MMVLASVLEDAVSISKELRPADQKEIIATRGYPAFLDAMVDGFYASKQPLTLHVNGKPSAMFGIVPCNEEKTCRIWLLATSEIEEVPMYFLRNSKYWFNKITEGYDFIFNLAHRDNELHLKWLRWMGFDISDPTDESEFVFVSYISETD